MAFALGDRLFETTVTEGTGSYALLGAATGFRNLSVIGGSQCSYVVIMGSQWECGIGAISGASLSRLLILSSSNGGSTVNWSAGTKEVRCDVLAAIAMTMYHGAPRWAGTFGGTAAALTSTLFPPIYSYWTGLSLIGITPVSLTNSAVTLNVNGLGAQPVRQHDNNTISTTAYGSNEVLQFVYDGSAFRILQNDVTVTGGGGEVPATRQIATISSLQGGGDLSANRTLSLVGDTTTPAANHVYGTNSAGARGWKPDPAGAASGHTHSRRVFGASGTYTKPAGLIAVFVRCQAPGGGSGGTQSTNSSEGAASPGGGGGEYREGWLNASAVSANTTVTIGARGQGGSAGNNDGTDGGQVSFGSHITALGGQGSVGGAASDLNPGLNGANGGAGGTSSGSLISPLVIVGNRGGASKLILGTPVPTNNGGASFMGTGASARGNSDGEPGSNYGGGGAGSCSSSSQGSRPGADGGGGVCIIEEVIST